MQVRAIREGYYDLKRKKEGVVFDIKNEVEFSHCWMEPVGWLPKSAPPLEMKRYTEVTPVALQGEVAPKPKGRPKSKLAKPEVNLPTGDSDVI